MGNRSSVASGKHPYLRKGFWENPNNQFWEKSESYNKEKYRKLNNIKNGPTKFIKSNS